MKINSETLKTKTFWISITGIITALSGFFTGSISTAEAAQMATMSLFGITFRDAMTTNKKGK